MSQAQVTRLRPAPPNPRLAEVIRDALAAVRRLNAQQREDFVSAIEQACALAAEVAENPAQPDGVRDLARRFVADEEARIANITAISSRTAP